VIWRFGAIPLTFLSLSALELSRWRGPPLQGFPFELLVMLATGRGRFTENRQRHVTGPPANHRRFLNSSRAGPIAGTQEGERAAKTRICTNPSPIPGRCWNAARSEIFCYPDGKILSSLIFDAGRRIGEVANGGPNGTRAWFKTRAKDGS
jgi:hypothetical protein